MIINEAGKYKTNREYKGRAACSIWTIPEGTEFVVTSVSKDYKQFYSDTFGDWEYWDKDVTKL